MASKTASTIYRNYMRLDASLKDGHPHRKNTLKNMDSKSSLNALA